MHSEIVCTRFADGGRHDLDDPEDERDLRDLVEHFWNAKIRRLHHLNSPQRRLLDIAAPEIAAPEIDGPSVPAAT
jgi:hypothetical protein